MDSNQRSREGGHRRLALVGGVDFASMTAFSGDEGGVTHTGILHFARAYASTKLTQAIVGD